MPEAKTVVVAGATGRAGRLIVDELLNRGYKVRALVIPPFDPPRPPGFPAADIEFVEADLTSVPVLEKAVKSAQYLISAIGSKKPFSKAENDKIDNMGNQNLARAAKAQKLTHIVVISSIGTGDSRNTISLLYRLSMNPVLRAKEKSEAFIRSCGIAYTIIRPGGYTDNDLPDEIAFGEGGKVTGRVKRSQIARVCVDALEKPVMKNRTFEVVNRGAVKPGCQQFLIKL